MINETSRTLAGILLEASADDVDFDALCDATRATRRDHFAKVPSRFPSAVIDLALVTPQALHAQDLAFELRSASELVERVELFDVYRGANLPE